MTKIHLQCWYLFIICGFGVHSLQQLQHQHRCNTDTAQFDHLTPGWLQWQDIADNWRNSDHCHTKQHPHVTSRVVFIAILELGVPTEHKYTEIDDSRGHEILPRIGHHDLHSREDDR